MKGLGGWPWVSKGLGGSWQVLTGLFGFGQISEVLEANKGSGGQHLEFTKLHAEFHQLGQCSELVDVQNGFVEIDVGAFHPQHIRIVNLQQ